MGHQPSAEWGVPLAACQNRTRDGQQRVGRNLRRGASPVPTSQTPAATTPKPRLLDQVRQASPW